MQAYYGEIRLFAGNFAPAGWAFCDGQLLSISENDVLFTLIGTTYGGDGVTTFALPDLRGRVPIHQGQGPGLTNRIIGEVGGVENVVLTEGQMPAHTHRFVASDRPASTRTSAGATLAEPGRDFYSDTGAVVALGASSLSAVGGSLAHTNVMQYTCLHYIISLSGVFPSQT